VPLESREAAEVAIGRLVEEWAALTYSCLVEAAMASSEANEPVQSVATLVAEQAEVTGE